MSKIDTSNWKPFRLGGRDGIFIIHKGNRLTKSNMKNGDVPYIGASAKNNGITAWVGNLENQISGKKITVAYNGSVGASYWQEENFLASDDVNFCEANTTAYPTFHLTKRVALFLCTIIRTMGEKYSYTDKWTKEAMEDSIIYLPVNEANLPDWEYMATFIKNWESKCRAMMKCLRQPSLDDIINTNSWRKFKVDDLFLKITLKKKCKGFNKYEDLSQKRTNEFSLPVVNAKHGNNGIMYYARPSDFESAQMTLDVVYNGAIAAGDVYPQPQDTGILSDAYLIKLKFPCMSPAVLYFLSTVLQKSIKHKFGYDEKAIWDKVRKTTILLPATSEGTPDWGYMANYISNVWKQQAKKLTVLQLISNNT